MKNSTIIKYGPILAVVLLLFAIKPTPVHSQEIQWTSFEEALSTADSTGRHILIDVWAPWCGWCKKMEKEVYPKIQPNFERQFVFTRLNRDDNETLLTYRNQQLTPLRVAQHLNVQEVPGLVLLNSNGEYLLRLSGFREASQLRPILSYIASEAYQQQSFEEFISEGRL